MWTCYNFVNCKVKNPLQTPTHISPNTEVIKNMKAAVKIISKSFEKILGPNSGFTWGPRVILVQCEQGYSPAIQSTSPWVWGSAKSADVPRGRLHRAGWAGGSWPLCLTSQQSEVIGSRKSHLSSTIGCACAQHKNNISSIYTSEHQLLVSLSFARRERVKGGGVFAVLYFSLLKWINCVLKR